MDTINCFYHLILCVNTKGGLSLTAKPHFGGLNYEKLYKAYSSTGRKPAVEPKILFKVLTYAYTNNIYSGRKIETACKRDINFIWLLEGGKAPDHSTYCPIP